MDPVLRLNEFFVEGGSQKQSHVLLHITEPSTPEERRKGYFFAICEINGAESKNIVQLQKIIEDIENGYYETPDGADKNSLEIMLDRVNHEGAALLNSGALISCVAGAIRPPKIFFSFHGQPQIILFYKNKDGLYKKMDLTADNKDALDDKYLFPQIVEGKVSAGDYVFFGTPHIINYFDHDRLHKIITGRAAEEGAGHLQKTLAELKNGFSFGGLIINSEEAPDTYGSRPRPQPTETRRNLSPNSLFVTEQNTESTLSPSLFQRANKKIKDLLNSKRTPILRSASDMEDAEPPREASLKISGAHLRQHRLIKLNQITIKEYLLRTAEITWNTIKLIAGLIWWLLLFIGTLVGEALRNLALIFFVVTNWKNRRRAILNNWARGLDNCKEYIKQLPLLTKLLIIFSVVLAAAITASIIYTGWNQKEAARKKTYNETVQTIEIKKEAAVNALVYNNETMARAELSSASTLLSQLVCRDAEEKDKCQKLQIQLNEILAKTRRLSTVATRLLAEWDEAATGLFKINGKIISYGPATSTLFIYDLLTKERKTASFDQFNGFTAAAVPKENDYAVLLYNKKYLARFESANNSLQKIDVSYGQTDDASEIAGIVVYDRRLYSLDAALNKIYKHDSIKTGFAEGKNWLKEAVDLNGGADLTVEGDIFVLKNSGEIMRFTAGRPQSFSTIEIDPPLKGGRQIWSYNDLRYLYILESLEKRLIILEKDGRLKVQLTAAEFKRPTGMVVDEVGKTAYIIDSGKLFQINLPL